MSDPKPDAVLDSILSALNAHRRRATYGVVTALVPFELRPATAEIRFCRVFRQYVDECGSPERSRERENALVASIAQARDLDAMQAAVLHETVRRDLADHRRMYEYLRQKFLMLDVFPQNRGRFGLTYEHCIRAAGGRRVVQ